MCLSFTYTSRQGTCNLYQEGKDSLEDKLTPSPIYDFVQRIFYIGGAVVDEVFIVLICKSQDKSKHQNI